ncbi:MAG: 4-fold beta flower protein [Thermodesulfobacteriota bacterium]
MEPIYDSAGAIVAWKRGDDIHDLHGRAMAFLSNNNVVSYSGRHLGVLDKGFFRDHHGDVVAFMRGATGGPVLPVPSVPPIAPVPAVAPARPEPPVPPSSAVPSVRWSSFSWGQFIARE